MFPVILCDLTWSLLSHIGFGWSLHCWWCIFGCKNEIGNGLIDFSRVGENAVLDNHCSFRYYMLSLLYGLLSADNNLADLTCLGFKVPGRGCCGLVKRSFIFLSVCWWIPTVSLTSFASGFNYQHTNKPGCSNYFSCQDFDCVVEAP